MDGRPVWLASASYKSPITDRIIATGDLTDSKRKQMEQTLLDVLEGVGDLEAERLFRMNVTLCIHRALTEDEVANLPPEFHTCEAIDLAGGPIEILRQNVPPRPSTMPCEHPTQHTLVPGRPDLWLPLDCGECEPCKARAAIESYHPEAAIA